MVYHVRLHDRPSRVDSTVVCGEERTPKRLREQVSQEDEQPRSAKRRRAAFSSGYPPQFWDTLSKVHLTRRALREFDRRREQKNCASATGTTTSVAASPRLLRPNPRRLKEFAKDGGPDLAALRGYSDVSLAAVMSQSYSQSGKRSRNSNPSNHATSKTRKTSAYHAEFVQKMIDNNVYPTCYQLADGSRPPKPLNLEEIRNMLDQPRASLSPSACSDTVFEDFQYANVQARSETQATAKLIPYIAGSKDRHFKTAGNVKFNNLTKFDPNFTVLQPDEYDGAMPERVNLHVRTRLDKYIVPSTSKHLPIAPNFFREDKSAKGKADVAENQAMHNGATGARSMWHLQNYGSETRLYDGNAYTISSTYHPGTGTLQIYATHPAPPPPSSAGGGGGGSGCNGGSRKLKYFMTLVNAYSMIATSEGFRKGAAAYRNAREWAQQERDGFIAKANAIAQIQSGEARSSNTSENDSRFSSTLEGEPASSETSADELTLDCNTATKRQRRLNSSC